MFRKKYKTLNCAKYQECYCKCKKKLNNKERNAKISWKELNPQCGLPRAKLMLKVNIEG